MASKLISSFIITSISLISLGTTVPGVAASTTTTFPTNLTLNTDNTFNYSVSNRQVITAFEQTGTNVKDFIGVDAYNNMLQDDLLRRGGTYIRGNKYGFTIYLNSAVCKIVVFGSTAATSAALTWLLSALGMPYAAMPTIMGAVKGIMKRSAMKATALGWWGQFNNYKLTRWGYQ